MFTSEERTISSAKEEWLVSIIVVLLLGSFISLGHIRRVWWNIGYAIIHANEIIINVSLKIFDGVNCLPDENTIWRWLSTAIRIIIMELENTTAADADFVILHNISVSLPNGQNLVIASMAVIGIESARSMSKVQRLPIKIFLVFKLLLVSLFDLCLRRNTATRTKALNINAVTVTIVYKNMKMECQGSWVLWFKKYSCINSQSTAMLPSFLTYEPRCITSIDIYDKHHYLIDVTFQLDWK